VNGVVGRVDKILITKRELTLSGFACDDHLFTTSHQDCADCIVVIPCYFFGYLSQPSINILHKYCVLWHLQIFPSFSRIVHERKEAVITAYQLVILALDVGDIHVVGRWTNVFVLSSCEDIQSDQVNFSVPVLPGLGRGHLNNLTRAALNHDVSILPKSRALHWEGFRCSGISASEILSEIICHLVKGVLFIGSRQNNGRV